MGVTQRQTQQLQPRRLREWVPGSSLLQKPIQTFSSSKSTPPKLHEEQDGRVQDQAELPRGLRGVDQQADHHGILCLVCLSFYEFLVQPGRSSPPRICCSFQERVWGGTRPWHEADGIPDKEGRKVCLPGHLLRNQSTSLVHPLEMFLFLLHMKTN